MGLHVTLLIMGLFVRLLVCAKICPDGFSQDYGQCTDEDECSLLDSICGTYAECVNTNGSYYCICHHGFRSSKERFTAEGPSCQDINECLDTTHTCDLSQTCENTIGSFRCRCRPGYTEGRGDLACEDIDECVVRPGVCGDNHTCTNTPGSYSCSCPPGFKNRGGNITAPCEDVNECAVSPLVCGASSICTNTPGNYTCTCPRGFRKQGPEPGAPCQDVDECEMNSNVCGPHALCINTLGGFTCACLDGFSNHGNKPNGYCEDEDECDSNGLTCGLHGVCTNTPGSYTCTCPEGFSNQHNITTAPCEDINECDKDKNICGTSSAAICKNTNGSYTCMCHPGHSNYGNRQGKCMAINCDGNEDSSDDQAGAGLAHIWDRMRQNCEALKTGDKGEGQTSGDGLLEDVLSGTDDFLSNSQSLVDSSKVSSLFTMMEKAMMLIGPQLKRNQTKMESQHTEAELAVKRSPTPPTGELKLTAGHASFKTNWETAAGNGPYPGFAVAALVSYSSLTSSPSSSFEALKKELRAERTTEEEEEEKDDTDEEIQLRIISNVVTACVSNPDTHTLATDISFTFTHLEEKNESDILSYKCVFWDKGAWSRQGCVSSSNSTHTVCTCNHLSSFAVLMALYDIKHPFELQLLTWIGLAVSLACLLFCILTFSLCRSIRGTRTTIHLHLSISLFLADLIFLCGISRAQKPGCGLVAGLLHFFFLAAFSWMLLEGLQLYRMVVKVFHTSLRPTHLMAAGYGLPLAIVIISAIANPQGYGTDQYCWLSLRDGFIWAFFGPVCLIISLNAFFFVITLWKLAEKLTSLNPDLSSLQMVKGFTVTAIAQLCVLGGMWVFGCFMFESVVMAYLFTILNSLQGALIFILHCLMSKPVRDEYAKFLRGICASDKRYTEYTSNPSSSNSQQPLKSNPSTGQSQL